MNLKPEEYELIRQRMLDFTITYQEIYHEILDHLTSDIERKRDRGDLRSIAVILDELIAVDLGGAAGIKKMAREHEKLYRLKINRMVLKDYGRSIWWKTLVAVVFAVSVDQFIPDNPTYVLCLYGAVFLMLTSMEAIVWVKMRAITITDKKQSLLKTNIIWQVCVPMALLNIGLTVPNLISVVIHNKALGFIKLHPVIPIIIFCYTALYAESCYRVMRAEMKAAKA